MGIQKFEDLIVWQKAQELAENIYRSYDSIKDYTLKNQIINAAISISNNIAEGFARRLPNSFSIFISYAQGSNAEVRSMLYLSERLKLITRNDAKILIEESNTIGKMLTKLKASLDRNSKPH